MKLFLLQTSISHTSHTTEHTTADIYAKRKEKLFKHSPFIWKRMRSLTLSSLKWIFSHLKRRKKEKCFSRNAKLICQIFMNSHNNNSFFDPTPPPWATIAVLFRGKYWKWVLKVVICWYITNLIMIHFSGRNSTASGWVDISILVMPCTIPRLLLVSFSLVLCVFFPLFGLTS